MVWEGSNGDSGGKVAGSRRIAEDHVKGRTLWSAPSRAIFPVSLPRGDAGVGT